MIAVRLAAAGVLVAIGLSVPAAAQSPIRGLHAERFDVSLRLLADGSIDVKEHVIFRFTEDTFSHVDRTLSLARTDGIIDVRAAMDGRPLPEGTADGQVQIRRGRRAVRITWRFAETINATHAFTLEYRVMNAAFIANGRAAIAWTVLPSTHRYVIDEARVEWRVPPDAVRVEPTTLDDDRWTTGALTDGWMATRTAVGVNETVLLRDAFQASTLAVAIPAWQTHEDRAVQMAPSFLIGAATLLVMAAGVVGMIWLRYPRPAVDRAAVLPAAASDLPPALGATVAGPTVRVGMPQMQATLLDLARRGALEIRESGAGRARRFAFAMDAPHGLRPHEQVVTDALWLKMKHGVIDLKAARGPLLKALPAFRRAVLGELHALGFVDDERRAAARGLTLAGLVAVALGVAGLVVFAVMFGHLGDLPLVVPGAVIASGVLFLVAAQAMPVLTTPGAEASAAWRARRAWLKAAVRAPLEDAQWWPVAAGFGFARQLSKANPRGPAWLAHLSDPSAAMHAILVSVAVSSGAGGTGGVGGAGGSSSAG